MADGHRITYPCIICDRPLQFGPHIYDGRVVRGWGREMICNRCDKGNWDGIVPTPELEERFREKGIQPGRNAKGYIVIPA